MSTLAYLNRSLLWATHSVLVATSETWFATAMRLVGGAAPHPAYNSGFSKVGGACCKFMLTDDKHPVVIICLDGAALEAEHPSPRIAALLAHECVHVLQATWRDMDEAAPGDEVEAYAMQSLLEEVLVEYARQRREDAQ